MVREIDINEYLLSKSEYVLLDTRTPAEYEKAHIPGAKNLPLLDNEDRVKVGTTYKQKGREEAILLGFDLTGHKWRSFIENALVLAPNKKVVVYCWRGGMRSGIMAWVLDLYGFDVIKISKGYKSYRNWAFEQFEKTYPLLVLGGMTGSHKTEILIELKNQGEQIIDLEDLAKHCGSSYGSMNKKDQPSQEQFENLLAYELFLLDTNKRIWIEDESRTIGRKVIPENIFQIMRENYLVKIDIDREKRVDFLVEEYGVLNKDFLIEATLRIAKRLGPVQTTTAVEAIKQGNMREFVSTALVYYDKAYLRGLEMREKDKIITVSIDFINAEQYAKELIEQMKEQNI